ncbi:hypothetical protein FRB98_004101 [Tulasnella sp. 332]|nr:hypothetical protein FRB98_004101 [Tulasnella sp. 332]
MTRIDQDPTLAGTLPKTFLYGYSSASYQIEGGSQQDGRGPSNWDEALKDTANGNEAVNSYNLWRDDIELLKKYGATSYRFSISWSRIIPLGGRNDPINQMGLNYYSDLIDSLLAANITPFVTLTHFDMPLELENRYNGWLANGDKTESLFRDFENYARLLFKTFGDRPHIYTLLSAVFLKRDRWDNEVGMWKQGNNLILGHARAVDVYRREFQSAQHGVIGISLNCDWAEPIDGSAEAKAASLQVNDVILGWFADPIFLGKRNATVQSIAGSALEDFTPANWKLIHGSSDFFGLNHYGTKYCTGKIIVEPNLPQLFFGGAEQVAEDLHGKPIGRKGHAGHPYNVPWGFRKLLNAVHNKWTSASVTGKAIPIYITENGWSSEDEAKRTFEDIINDTERGEYYAGYIEAMLRAMNEDGVLIQGYLAWSLLE